MRLRKEDLDLDLDLAGVIWEWREKMDGWRGKMDLEVEY